MKKTIFKCLSLCLIAFLCSCSSDDKPYRLPLDEFQPIEIFYTFTDVDGTDLLDPSNPNNRLEQCYADFKGKRYYLDQPFEVNPNNENSKVNFQGLRLVKLDDKYAVAFGELDGSYFYKDELLEVYFTGRMNVLYIYSIWIWGDDGMPQFVRTYSRTKDQKVILASDTATPIIDNKIYKGGGTYGD